jgi:hypothetical protein
MRLAPSLRFAMWIVVGVWCLNSVPAAAAPPAYLRTIGAPGTAPGQLGPVLGVALGSDGDVFVLDDAHVSRFHPDGTFVSRWDPTVGLMLPYQDLKGIESDRNGSIFISTRGGGYPALVRQFDENGASIRDVSGDLQGHALWDPWGMGNSPGYGLYIADGSQLWRLQSGNLTLLPNGPGCGPGQVWGASGMAVVGNAVFETEYSERLQRITTAGAFVSELGSTSGCGSIRGYPRFVAPRDAGSLIVGDMLTDVVQIVSISGAVLESWGGAGSTHGTFAGPCGAAVAADGTIYVAHSWNQRGEGFGPGPTAAAGARWGQLKIRYR